MGGENDVNKYRHIATLAVISENSLHIFMSGLSLHGLLVHLTQFPIVLSWQQSTTTVY